MNYEEEDRDAPANRPVKFYESPIDNSAKDKRDQNCEYPERHNKEKLNGQTNSVNHNHRETGEKLTMKIPTRFLGEVIGRDGSKISELEKKTDSKIIITKDKDGDDNILVLVASNDNAIKAKNLIESMTKDDIEFVHSSDEHANVKPKPDYEEIDSTVIFEENDRQNREKCAKLRPIIKKFYVEHPEVAQMTDDDVQLFRILNNNIVADRIFKTEKSKPIPKPCPTFEHAFHNFPEILEQIKQAGFAVPSPIQRQAWPVLLSGEDLIGIAQAGTGKTLAFLLPALIHVNGQVKPRGGPRVLIMAATREFSLQIEKEVRKYHYKGIKAVCLHGGGKCTEQEEVAIEGVDIIIATPERLNDLAAAGHVNLESFTYVVLDEADRMLDMGFEPRIRKIMNSINSCRQIIITSATWPHGVRKLAESYMEDPVQVYVGGLDLGATHSVRQTIVLVEDKDKFNMLLQFALSMGPNDKAIVFCGQRATADDVASGMATLGIPCETWHRDKGQCDREQALQDITDGTIQILIATDVGSRGLDIDDLTLVVNYDFPMDFEEYVHRVGRMGRAGKFGESISFFTRNDWAHAEELIDILEEAHQNIPEYLYEMADRLQKRQKQRESTWAKIGVRFQGSGRRW
ncbi:hypothetical protein WA026_022903 [Henosepilachna vigintioctopunctata]|uniref:RNA helicase n=1 Tax=Henosepilachna vigintioctopunctata TaxID=420089 RepID=A0AAW1TPP7_9CUCU